MLEESELISSRGEGRRLIKQNGVRLDGESLTDPNQIIQHEGIIQVGKRRFLKVVK